MDTFVIGSDAKLTVEFINNDGDPVEPDALSYVVRDSSDDVILELVTVDPAQLAGKTDLDVTIPAGTHAAAGGYTLSAYLQVGLQTFTQDIIYGIAPQRRLEVLKNTFQTLANARYLADNMMNVQNFAMASQDRQMAALETAFGRLTRLNYLIPWSEVTDLQNRIAPHYVSRITPRMWPQMTPALFATYPEAFVQALRKAQIADANDVLDVNKISQKRRLGLLSESIGESSMMFKSGVRPLETTVARPALEYLTGYLDNRMTLTRS